MYRVLYQGGESRERAGESVDFMLVDVDGEELYAEAEPVDGDETGTYDGLRREILEQAEAAGIDAGILEFQYD